MAVTSRFGMRSERGHRLGHGYLPGQGRDEQVDMRGIAGREGYPDESPFPLDGAEDSQPFMGFDDEFQVDQVATGNLEKSSLFREHEVLLAGVLITYHASP